MTNAHSLRSAKNRYHFTTLQRSPIGPKVS